MQIHRMLMVTIALISIVGGSACGQEKTDEKADEAAKVIKAGIDTLIGYKTGGLPVSDEGFTNGITRLLELQEKGSFEAPRFVLEIAKKDKGTVIRVLKAIRKESEVDRQKAIDALITKIDPPTKKGEAKTAPTNAEADAAAANLKMGVDTLITYRAGGLPIGDEGFEKGISALLDLHDKGSHKATEFIVQIGLKEKSTSLKVLKALRKDAREERATTIDLLIAKIDPKKETKKEEKK